MTCQEAMAVTNTSPDLCTASTIVAVKNHMLSCKECRTELLHQGRVADARLSDLEKRASQLAAIRAVERALHSEKNDPELKGESLWSTSSRATRMP